VQKIFIVEILTAFMVEINPVLLERGVLGIEGTFYDLGPLEKLNPLNEGMFEGYHAIGVLQDEEIVIHPSLLYRPKEAPLRDHTIVD